LSGLAIINGEYLNIHTAGIKTIYFPLTEAAEMFLKQMRKGARKPQVSSYALVS
jgi:hypothetical protein